MSKETKPDAELVRLVEELLSAVHQRQQEHTSYTARGRASVKLKALYAYVQTIKDERDKLRDAAAFEIATLKYKLKSESENE